VFAQIAGGLCLFAGGALLSWTSLVGLGSGSNVSIYAPWVIDGPWAFVASIGWAALVVALIGSILRGRIKAHDGALLSSGLTLGSVAIGGYTPWLLSATPTGRLGLSLFLMPAVLRLVAFDGSGQPRVVPWRIELPRRLRVGALLCAAAALVGPYALLHPFAIHGSGQSGGTFTNTASGFLYSARPGEAVQAEAGLQLGLFPITVTDVRLVALPREIRVLRVTLGSNPPLLQPTPHARLHARVGARHSLWIGYAVTLTRCPSQTAAITRIRISYRELGLSLTQTVPLAGSNTILSCQ